MKKTITIVAIAFVVITGLTSCGKPFYLKTKIITVTNPNNPTGAQLNEEARRIIIKLADRYGAWIFSDEVYQGAELDGRASRFHAGSIAGSIPANWNSTST